MMVENTPRGAYQARKNDETFLARKAALQESDRKAEETGPESGPDSSVDEENANVVTIKTTEERLREAERIISSEIVYLNTIPVSLYYFSAVACFLQIGQSAALFFLAGIIGSENSHWYVSYPSSDVDRQEDGIRPVLTEVASFSLLYFAPTITLLSGLEHFCCVFFRKTYEWYIERNQNPFRWTEYTFSASLVKLVVAMQAGITDVHLLVAIVMLTAMTIQCGASHESENAKPRSEGRPQNWRPFLTGTMGHVTCWGFIMNYFAAYNRRVAEEDGSGWIIIIFLFLLDSAFAVLFFMQWKKIGPFEDYVVGEKAFMLLSFICKTLIAWVTMANTSTGGY